MSEVFQSAISENSRIQAEQRFVEVFSKSLASLIEREIVVSLEGPFSFDFKEVKAILPGEIIICTASTAEMAGCKTHIMMSKEVAAVLADLLNMGTGEAAFSPEEHLEPIRDVCKETIGTFYGEVSKAGGPRLVLEDAKTVLIDISPPDFIGSWTLSVLNIGPDPQAVIVKVTSNELLDAIVPPKTVQKKDADKGNGKENLNPEIKKEMSLVLDIELPISIELGRTHMLIRDIVKLSPGSVVELDKMSGEPVDLYVNNKRFARGEVVVIEENFAVRITELINPEERFASSKN